MFKQVVVLSGRVRSGKTTLAELLKEQFGTIIFRTRDHLKKLDPKTEFARDAMQKLGERLDKKTQGRWVCDGLMKFDMTENKGENNIVVVDAVRIRNQIVAIRKGYKDKVIHIHLNAPLGELVQRYKKKKKRKGIKELKSYHLVQLDPTEAKVKKLEDIADVVIDTKR